MKRYFTIDMDAISFSGLSIMEWIILENIHFLCSENGWCYAKKSQLCEHHDISTQMYRRYTVKLITDGWLKENTKSHLKTTKKYFDLVKQKFQSDRNKSFSESETKVSSASIKTELKRDNKEQKDKKEFKLPPQINKKLWAEFELHRKQIKKPLTDLARKKLIKILMDNLGQHQDMIDTTIANRWSGFFPKKQGHFTPKEPQVGSFNWRLQQKNDEIEAEVV